MILLKSWEQRCLDLITEFEKIAACVLSNKYDKDVICSTNKPIKRFKY